MVILSVVLFLYFNLDLVLATILKGNNNPPRIYIQADSNISFVKSLNQSTALDGAKYNNDVFSGSKFLSMKKKYKTQLIPITPRGKKTLYGVKKRIYSVKKTPKSLNSYIIESKNLMINEEKKKK